MQFFPGRESVGTQQPNSLVRRIARRGHEVIVISADYNLDNGRSEPEVEESMEPGSSAIFFISRDDRPDASIASLRPYKGKIYSTTLSDEDEEALRNELKDRLK
jgi:hypothetical protein